MNYTYTYRNNITHKEHNGTLIDISHRRSPIKIIQYRLLNRKRDNRLAELFFDYHGDINDVESVRAHLPGQYKKYANNLGLLRRSLLSLNYIVLKYKITVTKGPLCLGCLYNEGGQHYHMVAPHGCQL